MSQAFITKVIAPGIEGAKTAIAALETLLFSGQSVALITNDAEKEVLRDSDPLHSSEPTLVLLTGGSTATRKAVEIPVSRLRASALASEKATTSNVMWLSALALTSIAGTNTVVRSLLNGHPPIIWSGIGGSETFSPEGFIPALAETLKVREERGTKIATSLVPTQLHRLQNSEEALNLLSNFDVVLVGGAKFDETLRRKLSEQGINFIETYGATETCGGCIYDGVALPGVNVIIEKQTAHIFGKTNALCYRDGTPLHKWDSKDLAEIVESKIVIQGRSDNTVKVAGVSVNFDVISNALQTSFPDLISTAVAIEDEEYGFRIVVCANGETPGFESIVLQAIGVAKLPIEFKLIENIPLLANGKIDLQSLKARIR